MRLPGYRRKGPDPIGPTLMQGCPRSKPALLPKPRWHWRCHLLGCLPKGHTLSHEGEKWAVYLDTCARCHKLLDGPHARKR